ncbi:MAG: copper resistance CopC family protein [Janibacter sp.]
MNAPDRPAPRRLRRAVAAGSLSVAALLLVATPATAHDHLVSSTPAEGATLDTAPDSIDLTFSGEIEQVGAAVELVTEDGSMVALDTPSARGDTLTSEVTGDLAAGEHTVRWKVVSADNHPISGALPFEVEESDASSATSAPTQDRPTEQQTTGTTAAETEATGGTETAGVPGTSAMTTVALGAGGLALAGGLLVLLHRLRSRRH